MSDSNIKEILTLARAHSQAKARFVGSFRDFADSVGPLHVDRFWPMVDALADTIVKRKGEPKRSISEWVRARLFDHQFRVVGAESPADAKQRTVNEWFTIVQFARQYRDVVRALYSACDRWPDLDMSDDTFGDFLDSLVLHGRRTTEMVINREIATKQALGVRLFTHPLENMILRNNENYILMSVHDALIEYAPTVTHDLTDADLGYGPSVTKIPENPVSDAGSTTMNGMNLQEVATTLQNLLEKTTRPFPGTVQINLSQAEHEQLTKVVQMFQLADLVNYKVAQDSFPRLLAAVKLVLAIADNPFTNPDKISLAPKTRAQLDSAVKFAENRDRVL